MGGITIPLVTEFFWPLNKINHLSNFADKCHYSFTIGLFLFFALVTAASQIIGDPINCILPSEFPDAWKNFVHSFCFVTQTYLKDNSVSYPDGVEPVHIDINYYQWVPYVLIIQGVLFHLPYSIWLAMSKTSSVDFNFVVDESVKARASKSDEREKILAEIPHYLYQTKQDIDKRYVAYNGLGSYSTICYMLSKLLNLCNVLAQLALINHVVGYGHPDWGFKVILDPMNQMRWNTTGYFPRTAYCQFTADYVGQSNIREVQCALMSNFYNEKIYLTLYFWFILLAVITLSDILNMMAFLTTSYMTPCFRKRFMNLSNRKISSKFISEVLGLDGLFLLYFIRINAGSLIACEVTMKLYEAHHGGEYLQQANQAELEVCLVPDNGKMKVAKQKKRIAEYA